MANTKTNTPKVEKKTKFDCSYVDMQSFTPILAEESIARGNGYVKWGIGNDYPNYLYNIYKNCTTLQSIIKGAKTYTLGNGIIDNTGLPFENEDGDTVEEVIAKIIGDRWLYGGFALQVKFNTLGNIISIAHIDFRKCRTSEDGKTVWIHNKWGWGSNRADKFNAFNTKTCAADGVQIYYYKGCETSTVYPIPDYVAALCSAEILIKADVFHNNEMSNNYTGTAIVNFNNGVPSEEVKSQIEDAFDIKYTGVYNAGGVLLSFNESKEKETTITRVTPDNLDTRYKDTQEWARENVFIAFRAHPQLFGLPITSGFAAIEYNEAFQLYQKTEIAPKQQEIKRVFEKIFGRRDVIGFNIFTLESVDDRATEEQEVE